MSELIAGGAPAPESAAAPVVEIPEVPKAPEVVKADPLAKVIEQARLDRQARVAREAEVQDAKSQADKLKAEVDALRKSQAFEDDPVAYGKARGWTPEQQAFIGQVLLYDLVPDKAPSDLRQRLFEMRQARKESEATKAQTEAQARQEAELHRSQLEGYARLVENSIPSFDFGGLPESEAYYGEDRSTYHKSLVATAMNLANTAKAQGQIANLDPANVAKVLEAEVSKRMSARDARVAARKPKQVVPAAKVAVEDDKQVIETGSVRGLTGAGSPRPKAETDEERLKRAIEFGFRTK